jgi:hypothetical protein
VVVTTFKVYDLKAKMVPKVRGEHTAEDTAGVYGYRLKWPKVVDRHSEVLVRKLQAEL